MNRPIKESEFGILDFYYFIYLCSTHVSDFMVFFRRLIMVRVFFVCKFYREDFDSSVILFNFRIRVSECSIRIVHENLWPLQCIGVYIHGCMSMYANVHIKYILVYTYTKKNICRGQRFSWTYIC